MNEIEAKRKELKEGLFTDREIRLPSFNLGVEMARKDFIIKMVFMLSKYFQSIGNENFIQMKGDYSWNLFCNECYEYLQSLDTHNYDLVNRNNVNGQTVKGVNHISPNTQTPSTKQDNSGGILTEKSSVSRTNKTRENISKMEEKKNE